MYFTDSVPPSSSQTPSVPHASGETRHCPPDTHTHTHSQQSILMIKTSRQTYTCALQEMSVKVSEMTIN